jgi:protein-L-isoaspartate(D-aspartate) O-methyltransferase
MNFQAQRKEMVETQLKARGIKDEKVIDAFLKVPREKFIPDDQKNMAYFDGPLPIGHGQTISQPYIVALMTEALRLKGIEKVLEIGTGSGYQAAVIAQMGCKIYSVERIESIAVKAEGNLKNAGYRVKIKVGDGTLGWEEFSPYQRIIVTSAGPGIPDSLIAQLENNGKLIMPVGDLHIQELILISKSEKGLRRKNLGGCQFVPLKGKEGWQI